MLLILLAVLNPALAADNDAIAGTWRLVSWQVIIDNQPPHDIFGAHPKGFLVPSREGRAIVLTTAEKR